MAARRWRPLLLLAHVLGGVATLLLLLAGWLVDEAARRVGDLGPAWRAARPFPVVA